MENINNFDNVKPGTLALVEDGIGGANAILVYLNGLQEVRGFSISAEGVIGRSRAVPHECVIKAFGITCVDAVRIRELLTELYTGNGTACQNLYKIYERSTKIVDMTIEEVSEIVSARRGETIKVNIVESHSNKVDGDLEEEKEDEEEKESDCASPVTHTYDYSKEDDGGKIEPAIGDYVIYNGVKTVVEESAGGCDGCILQSCPCGRILCSASVRKDGKTIKLRSVVSANDGGGGTAEKREWELSEDSYNSIDPAVGDTVTVYGVRCTVVEGAGKCHICEARTNGCMYMHCTASERQDNEYVYLKKI